MDSLTAMPQLGGVALAPMPASTLPSTLTVLVPVESEYGEDYDEPREVTNVRFARTTEFSLMDGVGVQSGYVFQDGSKGLVYIDAATSGGAFEPPERAEVRVDGGEPMTVVKVTRHDHLDGSPHHWEVEVR